jgi:eukaryotic-like serine/threonine-protein kinase
VGQRADDRMAELESLSVTEPLAVGDRVLDRYRVVERIAAGGHSIVYRGEDERLSRPVCIKVFYKLGAEAGVRRTSYEHFVQEAFALSRLTHPNTLRIYDFGHLEAVGDEEVGAPFQVSEFMNGGTLARAIRTEGAMAAAEAVRVVSALCGALAEAHDCGIVHRDIKPKNILFGRAGPTRIPKLADFGIAKSNPVEHELLQNRAGDTEVVAGQRLVMYSPSWAAPEQLTGDPVQPSADIYSMALVTIYMLTGQVVFPAENLDEAYRKRSLSDELIDVAIASADLPAAAAALLKQACTFDRQGRPVSVSAFADALAQAFDVGAPPQTRAPSPELSTVPVERLEMPSGAVATPGRRIRRDDPAPAIAGRRAVFVPARGGTA